MTPRGPVIALLGAESTGKTTLARTLALALRAHGRRATVVAEYLREFCDTQGRTPRPEEQQDIAAEQWRRIDAAAASGDIVVADTTPLMIAVYSDFIFGDRSLYPAALEHQRACRLTLLTGLDLPWRADGLQRTGSYVRAPVDALVRAALGGMALPYCVVYGQDAARTEAAMSAVASSLGLDAADPTLPRVRLSGRCRECLQPECEHLRASDPPGPAP